jgi:glycosyltransferase involved in cell wall biosynthesis
MSRIIYKNSSKKGLHQAPPVVRPALWKPDEKHLLNKLCDGVYVVSDFGGSMDDNYRLGLMDFKMRKLGIAYHLVNLKAVREDNHKVYAQHRIRFQTFWNKFGIKRSSDLIKTIGHKEIIIHAKNHNYRRICILSDQILFHNNFDQVLSDKAKIIRNHQAVYLGGINKNWNNLQKLDNLESYSLNRKHKTLGTFGLCLSRNLINAIHLEYVGLGIRTNTGSGYPPKKALDHLVFDLVVNQEGSRKKKGITHFDGRVIYPNLVVPFLGNRDQEYCKTRHFKVERYQALESDQYQETIQEIEKYLKKNRISLRQSFWEMGLWLSASDIKEKLGFWVSKWDNEWLKWIEQKEKNSVLLYHKNSLIHFVEGINQAFVVLVPSYNNEKVYQKNLESIICQKYLHYRMIYVNDRSTDQTGKLVRKWLDKGSHWGRSICLDQMVNQKQGSGRFLGFHLSDDDEIICLVDGDDWFFGDEVLRILNQEYLMHNLMCSYGSYYVYRKENLNKTLLKGARQFPERILQNRTFRDYQWTSQHLRTGRAKLFKQIKLIDIMDHEGKFLRMCTDVAEMMPVLEMAGLHQKNIMKPLYVYNRGNSVRYKTSFYRLKEEGNEKNQKYHDKIKKGINDITPYPAMALKNLFAWNGVKRKINIVWKGQKEDIDGLFGYDISLWSVNHYENGSMDQLESWTPSFYVEDYADFEYYFNYLKYFEMVDADYLGWAPHDQLPPCYIYLTHAGYTKNQHVVAARLLGVKKNRDWLQGANEGDVWPGIYRPKILKQFTKGNRSGLKLICLAVRNQDSNEEELDEDSNEEELDENKDKLVKDQDKFVRDEDELVEDEDTVEISIDSELDSIDNK